MYIKLEHGLCVRRADPDSDAKGCPCDGACKCHRQKRALEALFQAVGATKKKKKKLKPHTKKGICEHCLDDAVEAFDWDGQQLAGYWYGDV